MSLLELIILVKYLEIDLFSILETSNTKFYLFGYIITSCIIFVLANKMSK